MPSIKNPKQGDVYLSSREIAQNLDISVRAIYQLRNSNKIRWIENSVLFNLDDVYEYVGKNGYENLIKDVNRAVGLSD